MKKFLTLLLLTVLVLTGCSSSAEQLSTLSLSPVPYFMKVDSTIAPHLSVSAPSGEWPKEAKKAGAIDQSVIYYSPINGAKVIFMSVYYFPAKVFDSLKNPNELPAFGQEVIRKGGLVLSVAGPQDSIFDPKSQDGKNISTLYATITKPSTYTPAP